MHNRNIEQKMRFAWKFLVMGLFFCVCNGAPPKEVSSSSNSRRCFRFTEAEDMLIIQELLYISGDSVQIFGKPLWESIAQKHHEKWKQKVPGFSCERNSRGLCERFTRTLIHNLPHIKVKAPETLLRRFPVLNNYKPKRAIRRRYTSEETKLILEELSKPSYTARHAMSTWETIKEIHDKKRNEGCHGFENKRTVESLRKHMEVMKLKGQLPNEVLMKVHTNITGGSTSRSTPPGETAESQETEEYQDDEDWANDMIRSPIYEDRTELV